jgi:hypothetical protein
MSVANAGVNYIDTKLTMSDPCIARQSMAAWFFNYRISNRPNKKLIILGGSSARDGLRPHELKIYLPNYDIHNLSSSAANITEMLNTVRFLRDTSAENAFSNTIFVLGIFSGSMISNRARGWEKNNGPFDLNLGNSKFYSKSEDGNYKPFLNNKISQLLVYVNMPMYCLAPLDKSKSIYLLVARVAQNYIPFLFPKVPAAKNEIMTPERRKKILNRMAKMVFKDGLNDEPFEEQKLELIALSDLIEKMGGRLILAQIPVAPWFKKQSGITNLFLTEFNEFKNYEGWSAVEMAHGFTDRDFTDHAHPKDDSTILWAKSLISVLNDK